MWGRKRRERIERARIESDERIREAVAASKAHWRQEHRIDVVLVARRFKPEATPAEIDRALDYVANCVPFGSFTKDVLMGLGAYDVIDKLDGEFRA
jgi:hypothetical protein